MRISALIGLVGLMLSACLKDEGLKIAPNATPAPLNDGWTISKPQAQGFDEVLLAEALQYFFSPTALHNSKALLIAKNGQLVLEAYSKDLADRDRKHNIKSVTKSITTVVTGMAIQQGLLDTNLHRTVYSYIPEHFDEDQNKRSITLEHCLTMTTGLTDPFYTVASVLPNNSVATCLGVDLLHPPGTQHTYNNGSANIIGGVVEKMSALSFEAFTQANLFAPLGIVDYHWVKHGDGRVNPAFDLYLFPRDLLKWGQFCLQNGYWKGQQLLPPQWMQRSTQPYEDGFDGPFGFHWWLVEAHQGYYANGHGGQRVWIIPQHQLVVVHLAEPSTDQTNLSEIPVLLDKIMAAL